jgi:class 3 adenylate cyclase
MMNDRRIDGELNAMLREQDLWEKFGATCAMVIVDSCGFFRTTRTHGIVHFLERIVEMRSIVIPLFMRMGSGPVRVMADNIFTEFEHPAGAFEATLAANEAIAASGLMLTDQEPFRICTGIGYGPVLRCGTEGIFGDEMNLASKLGEDIAGGGEILLTGSAFIQLSEEQRSRFEMREMILAGIPVSYYSTLYEGPYNNG